MSGRILVIEDDSGIRAMLARGLGVAAYAMTEAPDLATGRSLWTSGAFDVVLLDVMLPDGNGLELVAERRAAGDGTPVVVLSAREETELRERAATAGATAYLPKPFAYAELLACLAALAPADRRAGG